MRTLLQRKSWFCLLTLIISLFIFQGVLANIAGPTMSNECKWWIDDDGILIFTPSSGSDCTLESGSSASDWSWKDYRQNIKGINVYPTTAKVYFGADAAYAFADFKYCSNWAGLKYFDATNLKNAAHMFQNCELLTNSDTFKDWEPTVTNIEGLFKYCHSLTDLDLSKWNITSAVTSLNETFNVCRDGSTYDSYNTCTTDGVLKSLNLGGWDLTGVIDMSNTFEGVPSGLALGIDYCDPQKPVSYPESPYIYNKHSLADAPSDWIFEPYAVTVSFTGDGKDTGQYTRTDSNAMTNAQAYFEAVQRIDSGKTYDSTAIYYQEGKLSTLEFSTSESSHYEITEVQRNSTVVTDYSISSMDGDYSYEVKLDKIKYTLTYLDGGADNGAVPTSAADTPWNDEVTVLGNSGSLTKTGYDFAGWSDGTTVYQENDKFNMPDQAVNLTAQYTVHTYTLYFTPGAGATGSIPSYVTYPFGTVVTLPTSDPAQCDYSKPGYTLTGWLNDNQGHYDLGGTTLVMPAGDMLLTAEFTPNSYTLTYVAGDEVTGDVPGSVSIDYDETITIPATTLTKVGYTFKGWSDDGGTTIYNYDGTGTYTMQTTDNVTLTAIFDPIDYTVTYEAPDAESGTAPTDSNIYHYKDSVSLADSGDLVKTGYSFAGWKSSADSVTYQPSDPFSMPAENVTLTAQFTKNSYTLTYDLQGGTDSTGTIPTDPVGYNYQQAVDVVDGSVLQKPGYAFNHWADLGGNPVSSGTAVFTMPAGNLTLTAVYDHVPYSVTYSAPDKTSGTEPSDTTIYYYEDSVTVLALGDVVKTGHDFTGWKNSVDGEIYQPTDTLNMPESNVTLTAQFSINSYTLTYDILDASDPDHTIPDPQTVVYGTSMDVADGADLVKTGYTFAHWADLGGNPVNPGTAVFTMPAGNLTLTAVFTPIDYTVIYEATDADSGTVPTDSTAYHYEDTVTVLGDNGITKTHYYFAGWKNSVDGNVYNEDETFDMPAENVTLTAVFEPNPHTLTYTKGNGDGADQTETVAYGKTINLSTGTGFSKTGYGLSSWTYGTDSYTPGAEFTMPDSDVTMVAVFTPGKYTVFYDIDGATGTNPTGAAVDYQATVTVADASGFSKEGYSFVNWLDTADGTTTYNAGATFLMPDKDMTLKAQYSVNSYTLSYDAGNGTGTLPASVTQDYGTTVTLADGSGLTANNTGWSFANWTDGTNTYQAGDSFTIPAQNVTLTAEYAPNVHTLTYTAAEVTSPTLPDPANVSYGTVVTAADGSGLSLTGYVFVYWTDGMNKYASGQTFTMPDADVTLEAIFAEKEYEVIFTIGSSQSGTVPDTVISTLNDDGTISFILPENTGELAKSGCYFAGWKDVDKGTIYQPGDVYTLNLAAKGLLTIITINFEPVFAKNNQEMDFYALPGAYEYDLPAAFENVTAMPGTGFSALRPTVLREQPAALEYHKTALELMLPSQEVNAAVQVIPMENGSWAVDWLGSTAGMLEGSAMPGEGPCFIAAHNHLNNTEAGPFWALSSLNVNDRLFVRDADTGELKTYSVYESVQYGPNDFAEMAAKAYGEEAGLVLITCEDEAAEGGYIHRRVVFAK